MRFDIRECYGSELLPEIVRLRYEVLRKPLGLSLEQSRFAGDELPTTVHFVGSIDNVFVACLTILMSDDQRSGQLRGMAVAENCRGQGLGGKLLEASHLWAMAKKIPSNDFSLWCNARSRAVAFYARNGWVVTGPQFDVAGVGPHFPMVWKPGIQSGSRERFRL